MFAEHLGFSLCSVYPLLFPHQIGWAFLPDPATQFENRFHLSVLHPGLRKPGPRIHIGSGASWALISLCSPRQLQLPSPTSPTSQPHQQPALRFVTEEIYVTCLALHLCVSPGLWGDLRHLLSTGGWVLQPWRDLLPARWVLPLLVVSLLHLLLRPWTPPAPRTRSSLCSVALPKTTKNGGRESISTSRKWSWPVVVLVVVLFLLIDGIPFSPGFSFPPPVRGVATTFEILTKEKEKGFLDLRLL